YDECAPRVYRLAYRITGDAEMARECTQDTFVRAYARLARFRGESAFSTWLHRITVTVAADAMRRRKRLRDRETQLDDRLSIPCGDGDGVDPILRGRLHRAIDALPEIYRLTVILHDIEGYTHVEIAEMLGVAEGTCKSRLSLARARLRAALGGVAKELE
ncbi:MAG: RNA polymerase sigma factor, partial [Longimicrobiales bacterium]